MHLVLNIPAVYPARQAGGNRFEGAFRTLADRTGGLAVVDGIENVHSMVNDTAATEREDFGKRCPGGNLFSDLFVISGYFASSNEMSS